MLDTGTRLIDQVCDGEQSSVVGHHMSDNQHQQQPRVSDV